MPIIKPEEYPTWANLLRLIERIEYGLEMRRPEETRSTDQFARQELANHVAHARKILEALEADDNPYRPRNYRAGERWDVEK